MRRWDGRVPSCSGERRLPPNRVTAELHFQKDAKTADLAYFCCIIKTAVSRKIQSSHTLLQIWLTLLLAVTAKRRDMSVSVEEFAETLNAEQ